MAFKHVPLVGLLLAGAACHVIRPVQPAQFIPAQHPPMVWVTYTDNSFVPVAQPEMVGDTLKGTWAGVSEPVSIPVGQIQTVQARVPSPKRTVLLFTVLGVATGAVAYTIAQGFGAATNNCGATKGTPNNFCCTVDPGDKNVIGSC
jgi:hypothetical protein